MMREELSGVQLTPRMRGPQGKIDELAKRLRYLRIDDPD